MAYSIVYISTCFSIWIWTSCFLLMESSLVAESIASFWNPGFSSCISSFLSVLVWLIINTVFLYVYLCNLWNTATASLACIQSTNLIHPCRYIDIATVFCKVSESILGTCMCLGQYAKLGKWYDNLLSLEPINLVKLLLFTKFQCYRKTQICCLYFWYFISEHTLNQSYPDRPMKLFPVLPCLTYVFTNFCLWNT